MFKIGDIITGKDNTPYTYTNNDAIMKVTSIIHKTVMAVLIIKHNTNDSKKGHEYYVNQRYFKLVTDKYDSLVERMINS